MEEKNVKWKHSVYGVLATLVVYVIVYFIIMEVVNYHYIAVGSFLTPMVVLIIMLSGFNGWYSLSFDKRDLSRPKAKKIVVSFLEENNIAYKAGSERGQPHFDLVDFGIRNTIVLRSDGNKTVVVLLKRVKDKTQKESFEFIKKELRNSILRAVQDLD